MTDEHLHSHDPLSGVYSRGYFAEELARIGRGRRFPVTIIVADLDRLQAVSERLLRQAARVLTAAVRGEDVVARIDDGKFAIILAGTDTEAAAKVMERIREEEACLNRDQDEFTMGMSLGLATAREGGDVEEAFRLADRRMAEDKGLRHAALAGLGS